MSAGDVAPKRSLTLLDCVGIGINGIVGSGIYLLISDLAGVAGYASVLGTLLCGGLCILIALCFAECSSMFDRNGGPYVYARAAFGPYVGFAVGWMSMATGVLAFAAVARGFAETLARFVPELSAPLMQLGSTTVDGRTLTAVALISVLGLINYLGVKAGARTSDLLSFSKLAPLLILALGGLLYVKGDVIAGVFSSDTVPAASGGYFSALASSAFLAVFMLSGFEFVAVPAGEAKEARRNIPIAIVGSLMGATLMYCVLQLVALSVVPDLATRKQPLIDAAVAIFGQGAQKVYLVATLVSMAGFCAGSALVGPRLFSALADDGYLPRAFSRTSRFGTPGMATLLATALSAGLAVILGFASLVDVSNVALFGQFIPTAIAVMVLRWKMPNALRVYRLPGGPIIPLLAAGISVLLLVKANTRAEEWLFSGKVLLGGGLVWSLTVLGRRAFAKPAVAGNQS